MIKRIMNLMKVQISSAKSIWNTLIVMNIFLASNIVQTNFYRIYFLRETLQFEKVLL